MNKSPALPLIIASLSCIADAAPPKKNPPPPKPQPSVKDLANAEARKYDTNYDGRISGPEVMVLRGVWPANPKSWLYLFDDNGDKRLDDQEIAAIRFTPAPKPAPPGSTSKAQAKKAKK
jgi:hypothetical protein